MKNLIVGLVCPQITDKWELLTFNGYLVSPVKGIFESHTTGIYIMVLLPQLFLAGTCSKARLMFQGQNYYIHSDLSIQPQQDASQKNKWGTSIGTGGGFMLLLPKASFPCG